MTCNEQNKILDAKIESNVNQYKVDRLNAEISAFSSGDLNKYEFLKRIDLNYKPNALDKARFEFSPLGKAFSMGLDKTAQGYQEEGVIKLLKDIRYSLAGGITSRAPGGPGLDRSDHDSDNDDDDNMPDLETEEEAAERIALNNFDEMFKNKENEFNKSLKDKENKFNKLKNYIKENNDKINNKEKEYNKLLLKYSEINRELNKTKDELYRATNDINELKKNSRKV